MVALAADIGAWSKAGPDGHTRTPFNTEHPAARRRRSVLGLRAERSAARGSDNEDEDEDEDERAGGGPHALTTRLVD
jgi:hypothetical protein